MLIPGWLGRGEDCEGLELLELNLEQQGHVSKESRNTPHPLQALYECMSLCNCYSR